MDYEHPSDWRWDLEAYEPTASPLATLRELTEKDMAKAAKREKKRKGHTLGFGRILDREGD